MHLIRLSFSNWLNLSSESVCPCFTRIFFFLSSQISGLCDYFKIFERLRFIYVKCTRVCRVLVSDANETIIYVDHACFEWILKTYPKCPISVGRVSQSCSVKKVFLEISQNSQENTCARVSFLIKLQTWGLQLY